MNAKARKDPTYSLHLPAIFSLPGNEKKIFKFPGFKLQNDYGHFTF